MKNPLHKTIAACLLAFSLAAAALAQDGGLWRASSQAARTITGDIAFTDHNITINFLTFTMVRVRALTTDEVLGAFPDGGRQGAGSLYRMDISGDRKFLHKNTLCGDENVEWMAAYISGRSLTVIFFSGQKPPVLTLDGMNNATDICGTYTYVR